MCKSSNWMLRRTFIIFCKYAVMYLSKEFFKKHFLKDYLLTGTDKVAAVRMEFANALLVIKPFFEADLDLQLEFHKALVALNDDPDPDVIEAKENTEIEMI